jgi:hypothetical protein
MSSGLWKGVVVASLIAAGGCGPTDGYAHAAGGAAGSDVPWALHPVPPQGPTAADICAEFAAGLGDDLLEAQTYAELVDGGVYLSVWQTSDPIPLCEDVCQDSWIFSMVLPLPIRESFDLAANEVLGDFTVSSTQGKQCGCLAGAGLASGSIDIVAMDAEAVCGWMVEDELFGVSGAFSTPVHTP